MPVHIAITRRVRPGCEEAFQRALREFLQASFAHTAVVGANMIVPPPGSTSREFGILRTFLTEEERRAFYASPLYQEWEARVAPLTEGQPACRELHGLEAFFRGSGPKPPPRWKMALLTFVAVYPLTSVFPRLFGGLLPGWPPLALNLVITSAVVGSLTWVIMPLLTRALRPWLTPAHS